MLRTCFIALLLLTLPPVRSTAQQPAPSQEQNNQPPQLPQGGIEQQRLEAPGERIHQALPPALERINAAADLSTLADPELRPWHMLVAFDLLEPAGTVREHGTIETWWASPKRNRITITSPSYTGTRTRLDNTVYRTKGQAETPDLVDLIISQAMTPLDRIPPDDSLTALSEKKLFGKVSLDCIHASLQKRSRPSLPWRIHNLLLRARRSRPSHSDPISRTVHHPQQNSQVPEPGTGHEPRCDRRGQDPPQVRDHFAHQLHPGRARVRSGSRPGCRPTCVPGRLCANGGKAAHESHALLPEIARQQHISGVVILRAHIGKDGRISSLTVTRSPAKSLADSALEAVRKWVYQPLLIDGAPTDVETTITVNFNMG